MHQESQGACEESLGQTTSPFIEKADAEPPAVKVQPDAAELKKIARIYAEAHLHPRAWELLRRYRDVIGAAEADAYLGMFTRGGFNYGASFNYVRSSLTTDGTIFVVDNRFKEEWVDVTRHKEAGARMLMTNLYNEAWQRFSIKVAHPGYREDLYMRPPALE